MKSIYFDEIFLAVMREKATFVNTTFGGSEAIAFVDEESGYYEEYIIAPTGKLLSKNWGKVRDAE